jgi:hypothetical protein
MQAVQNASRYLRAGSGSLASISNPILIDEPVPQGEAGHPRSTDGLPVGFRDSSDSLLRCLTEQALEIMIVIPIPENPYSQACAQIPEWKDPSLSPVDNLL